MRISAGMMLLQAVACAAAEDAAQRAVPAEAFVDRIEGDRAVLVLPDGRTREVPAAGLREGQHLREGRPDPEAASRLAESIAARRARLLRP